MIDTETLLKMARAFEARPETARRAVWEIGRILVEGRGETPDGGEAWCVTDGSATLARDGRWEWEPRPSARDEARLARTRLPSALEAIALARAFLESHPIGRLPEDLPEGAPGAATRTDG